MNSVICAETPENVTNEVENSPTLEEVEESPVELEIDVGGRNAMLTFFLKRT